MTAYDVPTRMGKTSTVLTIDEVLIRQLMTPERGGSVFSTNYLPGRLTNLQRVRHKHTYTTETLA